MAATLSPSVRLFAFVGLLAAAGLAGAFFLLGRTASESEPASASLTRTAPPAREAEPPPRAAAQPSAPAAASTASGLPLPIQRAARRHGVAVVVVYVPGSTVDAFVRGEARAGARSARAGYVAVRATNERVLRSLVAKTGILPSPAVVLVTRAGDVDAIFGVVDRELVAQAVTQARR